MKKNAFFFRSTAVADAFASAGVSAFTFPKSATDSNRQQPFFPSKVKEPKAEGILRARSDKHNVMPSIKVTPLAFSSNAG